jgi:hypothetical protein
MERLGKTGLLAVLTGLTLWAGQLTVPGAEGGASAPKTLPPGVKSLAAPGLHNLFAVGTNLFSGSTPEGEEAFAALAKLGVKTIITVDGAKPEVELARKHGLRYVHLPHGYDGINTHLQAQLAKAAQSLPGPFFVHCHHGKHRGPAAAAVICMANEVLTPLQAESWLVAAGTATNYTGLYDVVRKFHKPSPGELRALSPNFPETAKVSGLVDAMVGIDNRWDNLKAVRAAGYKAPKEHPDLQPANEAVILWEHYREAQRLPDTIRHGASLVEHFAMAETEVKEAERLLRLWAAEAKPDTRAQLDKAFEAMAKTCAACHKANRDPAGIKSKP